MLQSQVSPFQYNLIRSRLLKISANTIKNIKEHIFFVWLSVPGIYMYMTMADKLMYIPIYDTQN